MSDKSATIKEAQKFLARGQVDKAIAEWEKLVKDHPDGNVFNTIGDLYLKKGDQSSALDAFHKAADFFRREGFSLKALALYKKILNINSADAVSLMALGELNEGKGLVTDAIRFYLAAADSLSKEGKKEKLVDIYEKIVSLSPGNVPLRCKIAEIYIKEDFISEAATHFLYVAGHYAEKGDMEKSLEFYRKTLDVQPLNKDAIIGLNSVYERTGNIDKAVEQMKEAVSLFPEDTDILFRCADIHILSGKFAEAREYLGKITEIEPSNIKAKRLLGDAYLKEGQKDKAWAEYLPVIDEMLLDEKFDDAIELLESFKHIDPVETGKRLVSLYIQLGEYPQIVRELIALGDAYYETEKQREALNCYKEALKMSPDDEQLKDRVVELEKEVSLEPVSAGAEKTIDETLIEADIYTRYGLFEKAKHLLESFKDKYPENIDLHLRLKSLYADMGDKEQAVSECLTLHELYETSGDINMSEQVIKEAYQISPDDPRIAGMVTPSAQEETSDTGQEATATIEDYIEELAEADFYARQGLLDEAREILERLQSLFPDNTDISEKLASLSQVTEEAEKTEGVQTEAEEVELTEGIVEAEEIVEPALDSDVMDIFNEFKKGLEQELEEEDYETHYNLGIAYKEMGLIDDAIKEFQTSRKDPKRFIHSSNMLGVCYMEKGLYPLAVEVLKSGLEKMQDKDESYWAMRYDLAEAYEKNGNLRESLDNFTEVYGWNSKFRAVSDKINSLRTKIAEDTEHKKPKDRKDRVSYI